MARRKGNLSNPPSRWVDLLEEYDDFLDRVRMYWRRGGQDYRPMLAQDADGGETDEWDPRELGSTHFEWESVSERGPAQSREHITQIVAQLWDVAKRWTHSQGVWCDFKLIGIAADNTVLFEDGARCPAPEIEPEVEPDPAPGGAPDPARSRGRTDDHGERWSYGRGHDREMDQRTTKLLDRMTEERDKSIRIAMQSLEAAQKSFMSVQGSIDAAPRLINKASEVLRDTIEYESAKSRQAREDASGTLERQAHALSEMERSRRFGMAMELGKFAFEAGLANIGPILNRLIDAWGDRTHNMFPEFRCAQQAMTYLVTTLNQRQIRHVFDDKREAAAGFLGLLDAGAKLDDERQALDRIGKVVPVLRSQRFLDVANSEQQIATRYIFSRLAHYRMGEVGEQEDQPTEPG